MSAAAEAVFPVCSCSMELNVWQLQLLMLVNVQFKAGKVPHNRTSRTSVSSGVGETLINPC